LTEAYATAGCVPEGGDATASCSHAAKVGSATTAMEMKQSSDRPRIVCDVNMGLRIAAFCIGNNILVDEVSSSRV
jgi:hypothetical protein